MAKLEILFGPQFFHQIPKTVSPYCEIFELVVAGGGRGEKTRFPRSGMLVCKGHYLFIVVFYDVVRGQGNAFRLPFLYDAFAHFPYKGDISYGIFLQILDDEMIIDSPVKSPNDQGVHLLDGF